MKKVLPVRVIYLSLFISLAFCARSFAGDPLVPDETSDFLRFGGFVHGSYNLHDANFVASEIDVVSCCPVFEDGTGIGFAFGGLAEYAIMDGLFVGGRLGFYAYPAEMTTQEPQTFYDYENDDFYEGEIEHTLNSFPGFIGVEPTISYRVFGGLTLTAGANLGLLPVVKRFEHKEKIIDGPEGGSFVPGDNVTERLISDGNIDNIALQFGAIGGIGYEIPISKDKLWSLTPEVFYQHNFTDFVEGVDWSYSSIRAGVSIRYNIYKTTAPKSEPTPPDESPGPPVALSIDAAGVNDGVESETATFVVEEFESTRMKPLLTYVFFDENSSDLSEKYVRLTPYETSDFEEKDLHESGILDSYYNLLNIVGGRMLENPDAKINVEGCNMDYGSEKGNINLSENRAETVKKYLTDVWGIPGDRILTSSRNLPTEPSNVNVSDGRAENRRVEITSNSLAIIAPLITKDTARVTNPPILRFKPKAETQRTLKEWEVKTEQNGNTLYLFSGEGTPPITIDKYYDDYDPATPRRQGELDYRLAVIDENGERIESSTKSLNVEQITISQKRRDKVDDKYVDNYSLILFEFDAANLSYYNDQIMNMIKSRTEPDSKIFVTGHTDRMGDESYNKNLSRKRAEAAADYFDQNAASAGLGEENPKFDDNLPEGRFYNRRVDIRVETPIK